MNLVLSYALNALWQVPLVVCAGWLVSRLCRGLHPRVLHRVWPTTLLLAVIAPGLAAVRGWAMASTHAGAAGIRLLASGAEALPQEHIFAHWVVGAFQVMEYRSGELLHYLHSIRGAPPAARLDKDTKSGTFLDSRNTDARTPTNLGAMPESLERTLRLIAQLG